MASTIVEAAKQLELKPVESCPVENLKLTELWVDR